MPIPIKLFQRRLANISIGTTTLRGQGKGASSIAIDYLKNMPLNKFSDITNQDEFMRLLDKFTIELKYLLPNKSWGAARKAINIFLLQASYHHNFVNDYHLDKIIPYLEIPLDNPNANQLRFEAKKEGIWLEWVNIKNLTPEQSKKIQNFAFKFTKEKYKCPRGYLDLYFWRSED